MLLERLALQRAAAIVAVSGLVKQQMIAIHPGCARRIHVIHNGYQPANDPVATIHHPQLALPQELPSFDGFAAICVARLDRIKNIDHLLTAWSCMATPAARRRLWIVGSGPQHDRLVQLTHTLGIADSVAFLGTRFDVPKLIERSQVLVLPSCYEACGTVIVEALAAGVPCITLRNVPGRIAVGASGEINVDGVTGYCTDPDDPSDMARRLDALAADPHLRRSLSHAARIRTAEPLTWRSVARRYLAVIPQ
jgi:glycosyltransferase involved in cell wall biosynthesis